MKCLKPALIISDRKSAEKLLKNGILEDMILYLEDIDFRQNNKDSSMYLNRIIDTDLAYVFFYIRFDRRTKRCCNYTAQHY
ncbi:MAG: hypothetical protein ACLTDT_04390 [Clostridium sp.]